ncbi:hypothetical protein GCM10027435_02940 [Haloparvum alkalitolerans]|uniref:DUF58 domain-containing protein n=1 Tax=Haloparvum alkalitolerans TaxID=1042953 RepID=UPI003CE7020C
MELTRRWWLTAAIGLWLLAVAVLTQQAVLLYGGAAIAAWLLAVTLWSTQWILRTNTDLSVTTELSHAVTRTDEPVQATLTVTRTDTVGAVETTLPLPPGVSCPNGPPTVTLAAGERIADTTVSLTPTVVGQFELPTPRITFAEPFGYYTQTVETGSTPALTVSARTPSTLHVGQGGTPAIGAFGEHEGDRAGPGVTTRELREYLPGDAADAIDWKATARLGDVFVRETEAETDRRTVLLVDHRGRMASGREGETMLAYAREVGLGITQYAAETGDPLGLWTIGDEGITTAITPGSGPETYTRIRETLTGLQPAGEATPGGARAPAAVRRTADQLRDEEHQFARTLRPFVSAADPYVTRMRDDPLIETVRRVRTQLTADTTLAIVTTDTDPVRLKEAVRMATLGGGSALVFLTPQTLFGTAGLGDLDEAYDAYLSFEDLRREIAGYPRTTAFEVAPGDRLAAVLSNRREAQTA